MTSEPTRGRGVGVVVSTSAATDPALDTNGPTIAAWLRGHRFSVDEPVIVPDGGPIAETVTAALLADARVVITTGGTGVTLGVAPGLQVGASITTASADQLGLKEGSQAYGVIKASSVMIATD